MFLFATIFTLIHVRVKRYHHSSLVVGVLALLAGGCGFDPGCDRPQSLKLVVVAFHHSAQGYGNSTMTGRPVSG